MAIVWVHSPDCECLMNMSQCVYLSIPTTPCPQWPCVILYIVQEHFHVIQWNHSNLSPHKYTLAAGRYDSAIMVTSGPGGPAFLAHTKHFVWDMNNTKWCNAFYIQFRQSFAKETFSYDEHLKS